MRLPSRVTPYKNSTFAKFPIVLSALKEWDMPPYALYRKMKSKTLPIPPRQGGIYKREGGVTLC